MSIGLGAPNPHISEEAAEWFVEFRTGTLDERARRRFDAWIRTSPEHLRAYLEYAAIWEEGHRLDPLGRLDAATLMGRVQDEGNVVPLTARAAMPAPQARRKRPVRWRTGVAASLIAACTAVGGWVLLEGRSSYGTGVGEQRSLTLADGSVVELNARSRVKVHLSDTERRVELLAGQALFQVAKDPRRPFIVRSGGTTVRAVGTQFDVYRKPQGTVVTVLEGRVVVVREAHAEAVRSEAAHVADAASGPGPGSPPPPERPQKTRVAPVLLSAGEQAVVVAAGTVEKRPQPNLRAATAWTQRQLVFESATLEEIAQELNRYSPRRFVVDPSAPADLRLSGVFSATDMDFLVRFLQERPGIRVDDEGRRIVIRRAASTQRR